VPLSGTISNLHVPQAGRSPSTRTGARPP
jgi:hypothetical protein